MQALYLLSLCLLPCALAQVDLSSYREQRELRPGVYTLYWSFDVEQETIRFAVRVATLGWVGFGLSPTGGMPNSDIVIGWVNGEGTGFLHDRYAFAQSRPPVDPSQDWTLDGSMEDGGFTILAFSRNWVTCDDRDREIRVETARAIFAWNDADPAGDDPNAVAQHLPTNRATVSVNLLGGGQEAPVYNASEVSTLDIVVNNISLPAVTTTYWCAAFQLPPEIIATKHYIVSYAPVITPGNENIVHHLVTYECDRLQSIHVGESGACDSQVSNAVSQCRAGVIVAGWATGGTEYAFPEGVAYPIGGPGAPRFIVMETHYDNPTLISDVVDSSGLRFSYVATPPVHEAGVLQLGYFVGSAQVIPPGAQRFSSFAGCGSECTSSYFPEGGITVIYNLLHTHNAGVGATLHHYRRLSQDNGDNCSAIEELAPVEQNLQYDPDFQQYTILPTPVQVLPGDILYMECNYDTRNSDNVLLGGLSTLDNEMCLSFMAYYPRTNLASCITVPNALDPGYLENFRSAGYFPAGVRSDILQARGRDDLRDAWGQVNWTPEAIALFESDTRNGPVLDVCVPSDAQSFTEFEVFSKMGTTAVADCDYQPADQCTGFRPMDCCSRLGGGAATIYSSVLLICMAALLVIFTL